MPIALYPQRFSASSALASLGAPPSSRASATMSSTPRRRPRCVTAMCGQLMACIALRPCLVRH